MSVPLLSNSRLRKLLCVVVGVTLSSNGLAVAQEAGNFSGSLSHERDRVAEQTLRLAKDELTANEYGAAMRHLQRVLDADQDSLVLLNDTYRSAWDIADDWLSQLPPAGRATYARSFGQPAAEELALAMQSGSEAAMQRVARRYRLTEAGQRAVITLALRALDRGEPEIAAGWSRLIDLEMSDVRSNSLVQRLTKFIDPPTQTNSALVETIWPSDSSWRTETPFVSEARSEIAKSLAELDAQAIAPLLSAKPLVHNGRVYARQAGRLVAVEASTGDVLWQHNIDSRMAQLARNVDPRNRVWNATAMVVFLERLCRSTLLDQLSTDGERLFAIVGEPRVDANSRESVVKNTLVALSVEEGRLLWDTGTPVEPSLTGPTKDSSENSNEQLSNVFFLSTPQSVGHWRLVLGQKDNKVWLFTLAPEDGHLAWSVPLGQVVRTIEEDKSRQGTAGRIVIREGQAYCVTAAGSIGCVDLLSRRLLWSARYPRDDIPDPVSREESDRATRDLLLHRRLPTHDVWQDVFLHVTDDRVLIASPDANRLFVFDATDGREVWTRPRGDGLFVVGPVDDRLIVIGKEDATALQMSDGHELWTTPIARPAGQGILTRTQYVLPTLTGGLQSLELNDGSLKVLPSSLHSDVTAEVNGRALPVSYGPPPRLQPVEPRNLVTFTGGVLTQSFDTLRVVTQLSAENQNERQRQQLATTDTERSSTEQSRSPTSESIAVLAALLGQARTLIPLMHPKLATVEAAVDVAESLIPQLKAPHEQSADLIDELAIALQHNDRSQTRLTLLRLQRQPLSKVFVTMNSSGRTVRLDRWLADGLSDALTLNVDQQDRVTSMMSELLGADEAINRVTQMQWEERLGAHLWGMSVPSVTEADPPAEALTENDTLYVNAVPLTVTGESPWEWVTVQVDRPGRNVLLHRADHHSPVIISLPNSSGNSRMMTDFLHAWANGPHLCLRIGTEMFGFRINETNGDLPGEISWPPLGTNASLISDQWLNVSELQDLSPTPLPLWDDSQPGLFDLFGRPFVQVGPVTASCVCHWDRGHLIALDPSTGSELWTRFTFPVGTQCVGDDDHLVLLRTDTTTVEVLRSRDGQTVDTWDRQITLDSPDDILSQIVAVQGTLALRHSLPQQGDARDRIGQQLDSAIDNVTVSVVDLTTGHTLWTRHVSPEAWTVRIDTQLVGLIDLPNTLELLDWRTGREVANHQVTYPDQITSVEVITHAEQVFVLVSELSDDHNVFGSRQLHNSRRRPLINGWLHALDRSTGEHLWESQLVNVGIPLDQPRHVPLITASYTVRNANSQIPNGILRCYDSRTGHLIYEHTRPTSIYHTFRGDVIERRVELQLRKQIVTFDYSTTE